MNKIDEMKLISQIPKKAELEEIEAARKGFDTLNDRLLDIEAQLKAILSKLEE